MKFCRIILIFILYSNYSIAQNKSLWAIEQELYKDYEALSSNEDWEIREELAKKFKKKFESFLRKYPTTFDYTFTKLLSTKYFHITTSKDKRLKIYSWNEQTGGSMRIFCSIFQFKSNEKIVIDYPNDYEDTFYSAIHEVKIGQRTYYLAINNGIYSNKDASQAIEAFYIKNNKVIRSTDLFVSKNNQTGDIEVSYDFFSVVDRPERPVEIISYDNRLKIVYIALVDESGKVSNSNLLYQLKGEKFVYIGIKKAK
ncbi:MAG: hypothetical protein ACOVO2_09335 [Emticicia sp.]|uniref:hypothetical protein n=1 Tax=Emticicia sp. TaxID=1930953 RepID=UPI003BA7D30E